MAYNIENLRILWEFGLDGLRYANIVYASPSSAGDFQALNVKADIVEKLYRTQTEQTTCFIQFDSGQVDPALSAVKRTKSIYIDTFALLNTNLSLDAIITLKGYGSADTSVPSIAAMTSFGSTIFRKTKREMCGNDEYQRDLIWVSPVEQTQRFRHYLLEIVDNKNLDRYLEIGRVLGGEATILEEDQYTGSHSFESEITFEEVSYTDKVSINGFNEIANERSMKKKMSIRFSNVNIYSYNYRNLKTYWRYCRDTRKALIIPVPEDPTAFHVFAKLESVPKQTIRYVEAGHVYVDFDLDYDEAK